MKKHFMRNQYTDDLSVMHFSLEKNLIIIIIN